MTTTLPGHIGKWPVLPEPWRIKPQAHPSTIKRAKRPRKSSHGIAAASLPVRPRSRPCERKLPGFGALPFTFPTITGLCSQTHWLGPTAARETAASL